MSDENLQTAITQLLEQRIWATEKSALARLPAELTVRCSLPTSRAPAMTNQTGNISGDDRRVFSRSPRRPAAAWLDRLSEEHTAFSATTTHPAYRGPHVT